MLLTRELFLKLERSNAELQAENASLRKALQQAATPDIPQVSTRELNQAELAICHVAWSHPEWSATQIAKQLGYARTHVRNRLSSTYRKLGVCSRAQLTILMVANSAFRERAAARHRSHMKAAETAKRGGPRFLDLTAQVLD